jgi:hypothetical protein
MDRRLKMSNIFGFLFKSKKEREEEYREYYNKIFPYGEPQKQKVREILVGLINEKNVSSLMMHYILIKEAMLDSETKDYEEIAARIEKKRIIKLTPEIRECIRILIDKDLAMDESLEYPTVEELKSLAKKEA